jgi:2-polyprenyl-3-methyl-5-hydroxy-6-metoxy-1,4-benzoquinol methylase
MNKMSNAVKFWDFVANSYDKTEENFKPIFLKIHENIKKHLRKCDIVLDFGCGTGTLSVDIAGHVKEVHAIDISSKMLDIARRKAAGQKIENVNFTQTTLFDERYAANSFDVVLAIGILHVLKDRQQAVNRIAGLLKPGGVFISSTPCLGEKMTLLTKLKFYPVFLSMRMGLIPGNLKRFKIHELTNLMADGQFRIIETERIFHKLTSFYVVAKKV